MRIVYERTVRLRGGAINYQGSVRENDGLGFACDFRRLWF